MNMWTAIVLIVMATMAAEAWRHYVKSRGSNTSKDELEQINKRIDGLENDLRERVATLERIVTDGKENLKRQFDHLDKTG